MKITMKIVTKWKQAQTAIFSSDYIASPKMPLLFYPSQHISSGCVGSLHDTFGLVAVDIQSRWGADCQRYKPGSRLLSIRGWSREDPDGCLLSKERSDLIDLGGDIFLLLFRSFFFSRLLAPVSVVFPLESSFVAILFKVLFSGLWRTRIKEEKNSWIVVHLENSLWQWYRVNLPYFFSNTSSY